MRKMALNSKHTLLITENRIYIKYENICDDNRWICSLFSMNMIDFIEEWQSIDNLIDALNMSFFDDEIPEGFEIEQSMEITELNLED